jgi:hypothetical protein
MDHRVKPGGDEGGAPRATLTSRGVVQNAKNPSGVMPGLMSPLTRHAGPDRASMPMRRGEVVPGLRYAPSGLSVPAHRWLSRQAMLTKQADIRATTSILYIAGSENRQRSMSRVSAESPKVCFCRDSYLVYEKRRDSPLAKRGAANRSQP